MRQFQVLAAVFGGTLAVLLVAWLMIQQLAAGGNADARPSPSAAALASPTPAPSVATPSAAKPSPSAGPASSLPGDPTPSPEPAGTVAPGRTPGPTPPRVAAGTVVEITVPGADFVYKSVPAGGKVTIIGGSVVLESASNNIAQVVVTYQLPASKMPPGMKIVRVDVAVCGSGAGDFWETYGPAGSEPIEVEATQPAADGCWHYLGGTDADTLVVADVYLRSRLQIDRVVYTLTAG